MIRDKHFNTFLNFLYAILWLFFFLINFRPGPFDDLDFLYYGYIYLAISSSIFLTFIILDKIYAKIAAYYIILIIFIIYHLYDFFEPACFLEEPSMFDFFVWHCRTISFLIITYIFIYSLYVARKSYLEKSEDERKRERSAKAIIIRLSYPIIGIISATIIASLLESIELEDKLRILHENTRRYEIE